MVKDKKLTGFLFLFLYVKWCDQKVTGIYTIFIHSKPLHVLVLSHSM